MEVSATPLWVIAISVLFLDLVILALAFALFMVIVDLRVMLRTLQRATERFERLTERLEEEVGEISDSAQETLEILKEHPLVRFRPENLGLDKLFGRIALGFLRGRFRKKHAPPSRD